MKIDPNLWISVGLAIPLAIAANVLTPKLQNWLDERSQKTKKRKVEAREQRRHDQLKRTERELAEVSAFATNQKDLHGFLLITLLKVAFYGAFGSMYGTLFVFVGEFGKWDGPLGIIGRSGPQLISLFVASMIFMTSIKAIRIYRRVNRFEDYKKESEELIVKLKE